MSQAVLRMLDRTIEHLTSLPCTCRPSRQTGERDTCRRCLALHDLAQFKVIEPPIRPREYTDGVLRTESTNFHVFRVDPRMMHAIMGLSTEAGELMDALKRELFYGTGPKSLTNLNLMEELGDVFWYAALLAHAAGMSWEDIMVANLEKLRRRYPEKFDVDKAFNRNTENERRAVEDAALDGQRS